MNMQTRSRLAFFSAHVARQPFARLEPVQLQKHGLQFLKILRDGIVPLIAVGRIQLALLPPGRLLHLPFVHFPGMRSIQADRLETYPTGFALVIVAATLVRFRATAPVILRHD